MKQLLQQSIACCLTSLALLAGGRALLHSAPAPPPLLEPSKPETWGTELKKINEELRGMAVALISVAQDSDRPAKDRKKAIFLLARIRNKEALAFLASHVGLRLAEENRKGDKKQPDQTPCRDALLGIAKNDWVVAKAVLDSLDPPRTDREIGYLASVLRNSLGVNLSLRVLDNQVLRCQNPDRKKNLEALKKVITSD